MLIALLITQVVSLIAIIYLLVRTPPVAESDTRLGELSDKISGFDAYIREALNQIRSDIPNEASRTRNDNEAAASSLRNEVVGNITTLGNTLKEGLDSFRTDNAASATALRTEMEQKMRSIVQNFGEFKNDLMTSNSAHQDKLRTSVEERLAKLNTDNTAKLEEMRATVDEKLHATLHTRLTESFGQVTTHLGEVQKGLGEMKELANGVSTLNRVFTNVSRRGGFAEVQLGMQLEQILAPDQYIKNAQIKPLTAERVEFAIRFPKGQDEQVLLSIDAKFPKEDWERLQAAHESGIDIPKSGDKFEASIRRQAKLICEKYIDPPTTLPYAVMYLPTESLYAEVLRRPGLLSDLQSSFHITVAGPTTLMSILSNCQMLFYALSFQKRSDEVWKVLSLATTEFNNFSNLMGSVTEQVGTVQNTLKRIKGKTTTINRALKNVVPSSSATASSELEQIAGILPLLAAEEDQD